MRKKNPLQEIAKRLQRKTLLFRDAKRRKVCAKRQNGGNLSFHRRTVENSKKMWKTRNWNQKDGGKRGCKAKVTHTFHRWTVENSKFAEEAISAFCLLDRKKQGKNGRKVIAFSF